MKRTTSTLIIVVVLIVLAPLIGYFGTKYILLSMNKESNESIIEEPINEEQIDEEQIDEEPMEDSLSNDTTDEIINYSIELKQKSISMIQLASLSSSSNADAFIKEALNKNINSFKYEKDGLYKVMFSAYLDNEEIGTALNYIRETYSDAFITSVNLSAKTIEIKSSETIDIEILQNTVDEYFSVMNLFDDYAKAIISQSNVDGIASQMQNSLQPLDNQDIFIGEFGEKLQILINDAKYLTQNKYTNFATFNKDYIDLLQKVFNLY